MLTSEISFSKNNSCETKLNDCIKLENKCFKGFTDCKNQLEITTKLNEDLVKQLNKKEKTNTLSEIKIGLIVGSVCITVGVGLGFGLGMYLLRKK